MSLRQRILVVDDNLALLENIAECLEGEGFEVTVASSGEAALAKLSAPPPHDLALIDLLMPGISGEELLEQVRAMPGCERIRVVLISGLLPGRGRTGADAVLEKPFGLDRLLGTVRSQLAAAGGA